MESWTEDRFQHALAYLLKRLTEWLGRPVTDTEHAALAESEHVGVFQSLYQGPRKTSCYSSGDISGLAAVDVSSCMCYNGYMNDTPKEQRISIRFPLDVLAGLREAARQHERSFNGEVIWALRIYLAQQKGKKRADSESL